MNRIQRSPKQTTKLVTKWFKDDKVNILERPSRTPDFCEFCEFVGGAKRKCTNKAVSKPDSAPPGEMDQNSSKLL